MRTFRIVMTSALLASAAAAKLPPLDDTAKANAAEAAAKSGWSAKVDAYKLCLVQNDVVKHYRQDARQDAGRSGASGTAQPLAECADPGPYASKAVAQAAPASGAPKLEGAGAHSPAATATAPPVITERKDAIDPAEASRATPVGQPASAASRPVEASGAHSPAETSTAPPSSGGSAAGTPGLAARTAARAGTMADTGMSASTDSTASSKDASTLPTTGSSNAASGAANAAARAVSGDAEKSPASAFSVSPGGAAPPKSASTATAMPSASAPVGSASVSGTAGQASAAVPSVPGTTAPSSSTRSVPVSVAPALMQAASDQKMQADSSVSAAVTAAVSAAEAAAQAASVSRAGAPAAKP